MRMVEFASQRQEDREVGLGLVSMMKIGEVPMVAVPVLEVDQVMVVHVIVDQVEVEPHMERFLEAVQEQVVPVLQADLMVEGRMERIPMEDWHKKVVRVKK
jgi:hypothetical protein